MPLTSLAVRTTGAASATAAWEIFTSASVRTKIYELGIFLAAATASVYGIGRPGAVGVTPTSPVDFQAEDPGEPITAAAVQSALAWATGPTVPTNFLRRVSLPATIGAGIIFTWPKGLRIPVSASIVLWNITANGVVDAHAVVEY